MGHVFFLLTFRFWSFYGSLSDVGWTVAVPLRSILLKFRDCGKSIRFYSIFRAVNAFLKPMLQRDFVSLLPKKVSIKSSSALLFNVICSVAAGSLETIFWVKILKILWCGSGIRDGKNWDPGRKTFGYGINIPDSQHCLFVFKKVGIPTNIFPISCRVWTTWLKTFCPFLTRGHCAQQSKSARNGTGSSQKVNYNQCCSKQSFGSRSGLDPVSFR